ncbi:hypothetical protein VNO78_21062 [Psophocarpus tetragonolobus]|uniref:Uncharacterized protein n=1 Tax=Psophocarpus tetragonolobus TaxID=3891 RepID=A0AAN9XI19_PSOTE
MSFVWTINKNTIDDILCRHRKSETTPAITISPPLSVGFLHRGTGPDRHCRRQNAVEDPILNRWKKLRTQLKKAKNSSSTAGLNRNRIAGGESRNRLPAVQMKGPVLSQLPEGLFPEPSRSKPQG